jgi:hypothetical protein
MISSVIRSLHFVIPDLIGNPWTALSSLRNGQAMVSRIRGNDKIWIGGVSIGVSA